MLAIREAAKLIGVHEHTLRRWEKEGKITTHRTPGGQRRYDPSEVRRLSGAIDGDGRRNFIYCRVSSGKQQDDLEQQIARMQGQFPDYGVIRDIGSGVHYHRPGFRTLLEHILRGNVGRVAIAHRDRLGRFGYELVELVAQFFGTEIAVLHQEDQSPSEELAEDVIAVITSFAAKAHGKRKHTRHTHAQDEIANTGTDTRDTQGVDTSGETSVQSEPEHAENRGQHE